MALRPRRRDPGNAGGWRVRSGLPRRLVEALQEQRNSTEEREMHASRADLSQASSVDTAGIRRWAGGARFPIEYACTVRWGRFFAPPGLQPRFYEPFMIVDSRLRLQAVSYHAEVMLAVDEPAAVDVTLEEFLVCRNDQDQLDLSGLVRRAVGGSRLATRVTMRTVGDPAIEVVARVTGCGPSPAAFPWKHLRAPIQVEGLVDFMVRGGSSPLGRSGKALAQRGLVVSEGVVAPSDGGPTVITDDGG